MGLNWKCFPFGETEIQIKDLEKQKFYFMSIAQINFLIPTVSGEWGAAI